MVFSATFTPNSSPSCSAENTVATASCGPARCAGPPWCTMLPRSRQRRVVRLLWREQARHPHPPHPPSHKKIEKSRKRSRETLVALLVTSPLINNQNRSSRADFGVSHGDLPRTPAAYPPQPTLKIRSLTKIRYLFSKS